MDDTNWLRRVNTSTGKTVFFNLETWESTLTVPSSSKIWEERWDPNTQRTYYWNPVTRSSKWTLEGVDPPNQNPAGKSKAKKKKSVSSQSSAQFRSRSGTAETANRDQYKRSSSVSSSARMSPTLSSISNNMHLKDTGWREIWDEDTQRPFWFNDFTQESVWVKPSVLLSRLDSPGGDQGARVNNTNKEVSWQPMTDESTGRVYYYNPSTGTSQWEKPLHMNSPIDFQKQRQSVASVPSFEMRERSEVMKGYANASWEMLRDPRSGRVFFFNRDNGRSQWERPVELLDSSEKDNLTGNSQEKTDIEHAKAIWEELKDPESGKTFYFNRVDGTSQWTVPWEDRVKDQLNRSSDQDTLSPAKNIGHKSPSPPTNHPPEKPEVDDDSASVQEPLELDDEWTEVIDPETNRVFYYNVQTGKSQWIHPKQMKVSKTALKKEIDPEDVWCEIQDENTKRTYFYNKITGESRWTLAGAEVEIISDKNVKASSSDTRRSLESVEHGNDIKEESRSETTKDDGSKPEVSPLKTEKIEKIQMPEEFLPENVFSLSSANSRNSTDNDFLVDRKGSTASRFSYSSGLSYFAKLDTPEKATDSNSKSPAEEDDEPGNDLFSDRRASTLSFKSSASRRESLKSSPGRRESLKSSSSRRGSIESIKSRQTDFFPLNREKYSTRKKSFSSNAHDADTNIDSLNDRIRKQSLGNGSDSGDGVFGSFLRPFAASGGASSYRAANDDSLLAREMNDDRRNIQQNLKNIREHRKSLSHRRSIQLNRSLHPPQKESSVLLSGNLKKRARHGTRKGVSTWQQRYFIIEHNRIGNNPVQSVVLKYYKSEQDGIEMPKRPLASIDLVKVLRVSPLENNLGNYDDRFDFEIYGATGPILTLRTSTKENREKWMHVLREAMEISSSNQPRKIASGDIYDGDSVVSTLRDPPNPSPSLRRISNASRGDASSVRARQLYMQFAPQSPGHASHFGLDSVRSVSSRRNSVTQDGDLYARCIRSYASEAEGELSFAQGDLVRIVEKRELERWWVAETEDGQIGHILPSFIRLITDPSEKFRTKVHERRLSHSYVQNTSSSERWRSKVQKTLSFAGVNMDTLISSYRSNRESSTLYPTMSSLLHAREQLSLMNMRNHKLKCEVRGLQWLLHRYISNPESRTYIEPEKLRRLVSAMQKPSPVSGVKENAGRLVIFSRLLYYLQRTPRLIVQMGTSLNVEAQHVLATMVVNTLLDACSTSEELFLDLIKEALGAVTAAEATLALSLRSDLLFNHCSPVSSRRSSTRRASKVEGKTGQKGLFLPALLLSLMQREDCRDYFKRVITPIRNRIAQVLVLRNDATRWQPIGVQVEDTEDSFGFGQNEDSNNEIFEFSQGALDISQIILEEMCETSSLERVPSVMRSICQILATFGGTGLVRNFIVNVMLFSFSHNPHFSATNGIDFSGVEIDSRTLELRMSQVYTIVRAVNCHASGGVRFNIQRSLVDGDFQACIMNTKKTLESFVSKFIDNSTILPESTFREKKSLNLGSSKKPKELCDLIVVSTFELYMLHISLNTHVHSAVNRSYNTSNETYIPSKCHELMADLGPPSPLTDSEDGNPYFIMTLADVSQRESGDTNDYSDYLSYNPHSQPLDLHGNMYKGLGENTHKLLVRVIRMISKEDVVSEEQGMTLANMLEDVRDELKRSYADQQQLSVGQELANEFFSSFVAERDRLMDVIRGSIDSLPESPPKRNSSDFSSPPNGKTMSEVGSPIKQYREPRVLNVRLEDNEEDDDNLDSYSANGENPNSNSLANLLTTVFSPLKLNRNEE